VVLFLFLGASAARSAGAGPGYPLQFLDPQKGAARMAQAPFWGSAVFPLLSLARGLIRHPWRIKPLDFACGKIHLSACGGEPFYSAIRGASMPFLSCKFFAKQKTYETIVAGLHAGRLRHLVGHGPKNT
jgi:hypothetical protein